MSLLNKISKLDLTQGTSSPIKDMETMSGPSFDKGLNSTLQPDSLAEVPTVSLYQDLDGNPGPLFDFGLNSSLHARSLNGLLFKTNEIPAVIPPGAFSLYQSNVNPEAGYNSNWPTVSPTGLSTDNFITPSGMFQGLGFDTALIEDTLNELPGFNFPQQSNFQDINGVPGPQFDNGLNSTLQQDSLVSMYQSTISPEINAGPSNLDLNGIDGPSFDNGPNPPYFHEDMLANMYQSVVNPEASYGNNTPGWPNVGPGTFDLNGNQGPQFDNGTGDGTNNLHTDMLAGIYQSTINPGASYGNNTPGWPSVGPGTFDLNGAGTIGEATFDNGIGDGMNNLHTDMLADMYQSSINPQASYQGNWPNVGPGTLDLNGGIPSRGKYVDNAPEGAFI